MYLYLRNIERAYKCRTWIVMHTPFPCIPNALDNLFDTTFVIESLTLGGVGCVSVECSMSGPCWL